MNKEEDKAIDRLDFVRSLDRSVETMRRRQDAILASLTPKEREVLRKRFGAATDQELIDGPKEK
jgi:DNA-directed RNA polymerase sigma subunit (sigma70/sigma32)